MVAYHFQTEPHCRNLQWLLYLPNTRGVSSVGRAPALQTPRPGAPSRHFVDISAVPRHFSDISSPRFSIERHAVVPNIAIKIATPTCREPPPLWRWPSLRAHGGVCWGGRHPGRHHNDLRSFVANSRAMSAPMNRKGRQRGLTLKPNDPRTCPRATGLLQLLSHS
jgi:hypothetical protein